MRFSESAIRDRLAQRYVLKHRNNGRARPNLEAAMKDLRACLREVGRLRWIRYFDQEAPELSARGVKEGAI